MATAKTKARRNPFLPPLRFEQAKTFQDIFAEWREWDANKHIRAAKEDHVALMGLGPYAHGADQRNGGRFFSFWAKPTQALVKALEPITIYVNNDELYFDLVVYKDGTTLVTVKHNQILGSTWLAFIKTSSIPKELFKKD